jgi:PAS domain S-box-containing protein
MVRRIHRNTDDAHLAEISEGRRAKETLCASEQGLQDIFDNSTAVVSVKDLDLRYMFANREYERHFHVQRDQIHGKTDHDIHPRAVAETLRANDLRVIETGTPIQFEAAVPMVKGRRHYIFVKFLLRDHAETPYAVCSIATDITASKRAEEIQVERARQAALRADIHAAFSVTQSTLPAMLQRSAQAFVDHLDAAVARIWTLNDLQNTLELQASAGLYTRSDGEHARVAVGKLKIGLIAQERKPLQTLYQCNQALVRAKEEYELLQSVCRILVDAGGLRMAWVGYRELNEEKTVRPVASAGHEEGYLEQVDITWAPWQVEALRRRCSSSIALPLKCHGEAFGALALYAEEPDAFNEKTVEQYTDLANNLAYGVMALRTREEHKRAEEALRESEQRLVTVSLPVLNQLDPIGTKGPVPSPAG